MQYISMLKRKLIKYNIYSENISMQSTSPFKSNLSPIHKSSQPGIHAETDVVKKLIAATTRANRILAKVKITDATKAALKAKSEFEAVENECVKLYPNIFKDTATFNDLNVDPKKVEIVEKLVQASKKLEIATQAMKRVATTVKATAGISN